MEGAKELLREGDRKGARKRGREDGSERRIVLGSQHRHTTQNFRFISDRVHDMKH